MEVDTADIDAQLEALLEEKQRRIDRARRDEERKAREDSKILVALTPSKKEKPKASNLLPAAPKAPSFVPQRAKAGLSRPPPQQTLPALPRAVAGPSSMASSLSGLRRPKVESSRTVTGSQWRGRSGSMPKPAAASDVKGKARASDDDDELEMEEEGVRRDDATLAILEKLTLGPKEFGFDPEGEQTWEYVEPNSEIRLSERRLPHSTLQDHMYGRYYLPPSLLYSVIRLSRDGATYDVPVEGDWVTIAVVAERGEVRVSGGGGGGGGNQADDGDSSEDESGKPAPQRGDFSLASPAKTAFRPKKVGAKDGRGEGNRKRGLKKYINLRLVALPPRSKSRPGNSAGGDAILQLLLFQAESIILEDQVEEDEKPKRTYKGGSGGAFEKWGSLNVGDVVGIINPRVLRPLKAGGSAPSPLTLPLALNPMSEDAIFLIGKSKDLGCCSAIQKDGKRCRTWVDLRQGQVCEYHVHLSMQRARSGRAEFTASTSSFALATRPAASTAPHRPSFPRKGVGINHHTKTGLLPAAGPQVAPCGAENGGGGATYVISGRTVHDRPNGELRHFGDERLADKLGRGRAEKARRKKDTLHTEEVLANLMKNGAGSSGHRNLNAIRAAAGKEKRKPDEKANLNDRRKRRKEREREDGESDESSGEDEDKKRPFTAESIKKIGYDPSAVARSAALGKDERKKKEETIALLKNPGGATKFDPRKKVKVTNVKAPAGERSGAMDRDRKDNWAMRRAQSDDEDEDDLIDLE